jgi:hypothetical protein
MTRVIAGLQRAARLQDDGYDIESLVDALAVDALAAMYPGEMPTLEDVYSRRWRARHPLPEHVVDAFVMATIGDDDV